MRTRAVVKGLIAVLGLVALLGVGACSSSPPTRVSAAEFAQAVQEPGTVVLDVRTPQEFADGHLPGAVNIDINAADFDQQLAGLDKTTHYAVYCQSGRRSAAAVERMKAAGFTSVVDLAGGLGDWAAVGGPLTTG